MSTKKQIAANRNNATLSTGPKSPDGKAISAMNGLRHGLRATTLILPGESREDFDRIHTQIQDLYMPQNPTEQQLVDQAANTQWKLLRAELYEASCYADATTAAQHLAILDRATLVAGRLQRTWLRLINDLERRQAARPVPGAPLENQPGHPAPPTSKIGKNGKKEYVPPPNLTYAWENPDTGERQVFYQTKDGVSLDIPLYPPDKPAPPAPGDPGQLPPKSPQND